MKLLQRLRFFKENDVTIDWLNNNFGLGKNYAEWILGNKSSIIIDEAKITQLDYRPYDIRWTYFDNKLIWRWRFETMQHLLKGGNLGLVIARQCVGDWKYVFLTKNMGEFNLTGKPGC